MTARDDLARVLRASALTPDLPDAQWREIADAVIREWLPTYEGGVRHRVLALQAANDEDRYLPGFHYKAQMLGRVLRELDDHA